MRADWLPAVLSAALEPRGYRVEVAPGAETRGSTSWGPLRWIIDHHTVSPAGSGNTPSLRICMYGRPGLAGPLCQVLDGRDATTIVVATGRANHAGYGRCPDGSNPNTTAIGRESENNGTGEPWPAPQREAQIIGDAAILRHLSRPADACRGHREVDPARKADPTYDMGDHRNAVARELGAPLPPPAPTPGGFLMALSDEEQNELLAKVRASHDALRGPAVGPDGLGDRIVLHDVMILRQQVHGLVAGQQQSLMLLASLLNVVDDDGSINTGTPIGKRVVEIQKELEALKAAVAA